MKSVEVSTCTLSLSLPSFLCLMGAYVSTLIVTVIVILTGKKRTQV